MKKYEKTIFEEENVNVTIENLAYLNSTGETFVTEESKFNNVKLKFVEQCDGQFVWHKVYINDKKEIDGELAYENTKDCKDGNNYVFPIYTEWD